MVYGKPYDKPYVVVSGDLKHLQVRSSGSASNPKINY